MIKANIKIESIFAFILGLCVCEGVSMPFSVGSTAFTFGEILSPLILICLLFNKNNTFLSFFRKVPVGFKLFFLMILFSVVPGTIMYGLGASYRFAVGLVYFFMVLSVAVNVYLLKDHKKYLFMGLAIGFGLNIALSLICYFSFRAGTVISLEQFIPRENFFTPTLTFRSQGLFLEPSHFVRFVSSVFLVLMANVSFKNSFLKFVFVAVTFFVILQSFSGSVVIFLLGILFYSMLKKNDTKKPLTASSFLVFLSIVIIAIILFTTSDIAANLQMIFGRIFSGANLADEGNELRFESMKAAFDNIYIAIIGCGWNLIGTFFESENLGIVSAFSDILEMTMELGFIGIAAYICSIISLALKLLKKGNANAIALGCSLLVIIALQTGTDYAFNTVIMLIFGLCICELAEAK